jgi:hypothetical protein
MERGGGQIRSGVKCQNIRDLRAAEKTSFVQLWSFANWEYSEAYIDSLPKKSG